MASAPYSNQSPLRTAGVFPSYSGKVALSDPVVKGVSSESISPREPIMALTPTVEIDAIDR
jgi:hypothetical protein